MSAYPLVWRVKVIRPEWFGRRCRIVIHGGKGNRLIEFENGERALAAAVDHAEKGETR